MSANHLSALFWSQWLAGDLSWRRRMQGAWHLRRCSTCYAAAGQPRDEQALYGKSAPFARGLAQLQSRQVVAAPSRRMWPAMALAGSMAAMLLVVKHPPESPSMLRPKGEATHFALYLQRGDNVSPLGAHCRPGDALRASYQSTRPYLLVVEVDDFGHTQVVFPADEVTSARVSAGRQLTPGSWILDDSPHQERFVALFSDVPLTLQQSRACVDAAEACGPHVMRQEVACSKD